MSAQIPGSVPTSKGAVCYGLDQISKGRRARARLSKLRKALAALPPNRKGIAETFDKYIFEHVHAFRKKTTRQKIVQHLNQFWFDPASPQTYFPGVPVAKIYADGVIQALKFSLNPTGPVVPLDCWWAVDAPEVELIVFAEREGNHTTSPIVSLNIQTPRPKPVPGIRAKPPWILGKAEAYVTRLDGRTVTTKRVKTLSGDRARPRR